MASGEGFGPAGPGSVGAPPFAVSGPSSVSLDASRSGAASFAVSNVTGRPVRVRLLVAPVAPAVPEWFTLAGEAERPLPLAGTTTVDVMVKVPESVPEGPQRFTVSAALEEAPNQVVSGPTVSFEVPPVRKRPFPWWIVIVAAVALVLLVAGGILIWVLTRPEEPPLPTDPAHDIYFTGSFTIAPGESIDADLETLIPPGSDEPADVFLQMDGGGEVLIVGFFETRLDEASGGTFEDCAAEEYAAVGEPLTFVSDHDVYICARFTDQGRMSVIHFAPQQPDGSVTADVTTWVRGE